MKEKDFITASNVAKLQVAQNILWQIVNGHSYGVDIQEAMKVIGLLESMIDSGGKQLGLPMPD